MVLLVLTSFSLLLWMLGSLFIAFVEAVPEGIGVEENCLTKQDPANVASSHNQQYFSLSGNAGIELYYDDGTAEWEYSWPSPGGMFAVRFTPPASGQLKECSFYISSNATTIKVRILDTDKNDMITPFLETPTSAGWFHVDLSTYGITVSPDVDFYVAMESTTSSAPWLGADESAPDGRSWDYNGVSWSQWWEDDYMIRAVIGGVDLKITDVYWEPSEPKQGDDVTFSADVVNQGTENATDFIVDFYLDEELIAWGSFSLAAGANDTYFYEWWTATLGSHTVRWVIDSTDVIDESDEGNNEMSETFIVGYVLTVQTPYSHITVKIDESSNSTDLDGNFQTVVDEGYHNVEVQTPVSLGTGSRGVFVQWSDGDSSNPRTIFVDNNLTLTAKYKTQYYLTVDSPYGTPSGEGWYDNCTTAYATLDTSIVDQGGGTRKVFTHWSGDASGTNYAQSDPIHMDGPKTATANWKTQYQVTVKQSGCETTVTATIDGDSHDLPIDFWFDEGSEHSISVPSTVAQYEFTQWHDDETAPSRTIVVTSSAEYTAYYALALSSSSIPPLSLSSPTINLGKTITVSGSIVPTREGVLVTLTYKKPDGTTFNRTVTSSSGGTFSDTYRLDAVGTWSVMASWRGDVDYYGATSPIREFTVEEKAVPPWEPLFRPEMLQIILALVGIVLTITIVGAAWASTRRKRGRVKDLLSEIDNTYFRYKVNIRRCEAELYRLKDIVLEEYKSGNIIEESYNILNERIDDYIKEIREQNK